MNLHTHIHINKSSHVHARRQTHYTNTNAYTCIHTSIHTNTSLHFCAHENAHRYTHTNVCRHAIYVKMHTHASTPFSFAAATAAFSFASFAAAALPPATLSLPMMYPLFFFQNEEIVLCLLIEISTHTNGRLLQTLLCHQLLCLLHDQDDVSSSATCQNYWAYASGKKM